MNKFKSMILELAGIDANLKPQRSPYKILERYKDMEDIHISFRSINKIGINPMTQHHTPLGIYAYPLKESWKEYLEYSDAKDKGSLSEYFPYASHQPYIYVLKEKKVNGIHDISSFNDHNSFYKIMQKINKFVEDKFYNSSIFKSGVFSSVDEFIDYYSQYESVDASAGVALWAVTREISFETINPPLFWNKILKDIAGINYISDRKGEGVIHSNEPIQTIFLATGAFDVVDVIVNDSSVFDKQRIRKEEFYSGLEKAVDRNDSEAFYNAIKKNLSMISFAKMTTAMLDYITLHADNAEFLKAYKDFGIKISRGALADLTHARCYNMVDYILDNYDDMIVSVDLSGKRQKRIAEDGKEIILPDAIDESLIHIFLSNNMPKMVDKFLEKTGINFDSIDPKLIQKYTMLKSN